MEIDLQEGRRLRDEGIAQTTESNERWHDLALIYIREWAQHAQGQEITGEGIRKAVEVDVGNPKHCNSWGALTSHAVRQGLLEDTGRSTQMATKQSHARRTPIWRFV